MKSSLIKITSAALLFVFICTGCAEHRYYNRDYDDREVSHRRHHHDNDGRNDYRDRDYHDDDHHHDSDH